MHKGGCLGYLWSMGLEIGISWNGLLIVSLELLFCYVVM